MQTHHIRTLFLALALTLGLAVLPVSAAGDSLTDLTWQAGPETTVVSTQQADGGTWLFLPSSADLTQLALTFGGGAITLSHGDRSVLIRSGTPFDLTALFAGPPDDGVWTVTLARGRDRLTLHLMQSENLRSLYLTSADPDKDRTWVEESKDNKAKGSAVLLRADGSTVYAGDLKQIKGRGNSTWDYPKKPYQIKLADKADLLEAGEEPEATWVLLANYCDETLLHNTLTYALARDFGLAFTPHCAPVDLYYDGEYRGSYLLSEKTEVGGGRVQIDDLEGAIQEANPEVEDLDALATATAQNASGNSYQYVSGLTAPEDCSGGYLLEMDFADRARAEKSWFTTSAGKYLVVKSPEYMPQTAMAYLSELWQGFEDAVANGSKDPATGRDYTQLMDLESLAKCYLMLELSQDGDAFQSSTYFYKPAGEEKFYAGPLWDFDSAYGSYGKESDVTALVAGQTQFGRRLLAIPSFRAAVQEACRDLHPLVEKAVQTDLPAFSETIAASRAMDRVLWPESASTPFDAAVEDLRAFVTQRNQWLYGEVMSWTEDTILPAGFSDVPADAWYAGDVDYVTAKGLMNGVSEVHFAPNGTMTRAMAVTVLWRMAGEPAAGTGGAFSDVAAGSWYEKAVAWAAETQVAGGYPDGTFRPDQAVTRQELVTLFARFARTQGGELTAPPIPETFPDRDQVPDWAREAFGWAIAQGILTGDADGSLSPGGLALRCQGAALFQRFHQTLNNVT